MGSQRRIREEARGWAEELGLVVMGFETTGGKHQRMLLRLKDGTHHGYILPGTPSDGRWRLNNRAALRRLARTGTLKPGVNYN